MTRRAIILLAAVSLFVGMLPAAAQTAAERNPERLGTPLSGDPLSQHRDPNQVVQVVVQFDRPSVARFVGDRIDATGVAPSQAQQTAQAAAISQQHTQMRSVLSPFVISEIGTMRVALNGFQVQVRRGDISSIERLPGVAKVSEVVRHERTHQNSMPHIGAPTVWGGTPGHTGEGIVIAVIDTGIDYHHSTFGGSGDPADFLNDDGLDVNDDFPNAKVIGGHDFAGDDYNANSSSTAIPQPDPNPLDCNGHGTHVAGTAAGFGVDSNGDPFEGPWDEEAFGNNFRVGPGVAPEALIFALRVFGCEGSTDLVALAIERALDPDEDGSMADAVDVINMSLGSGFGQPDDPSAAAAQNAVDAGVIVVASAGNAGNVPYITGSPATAPGAISVAANSAAGFQSVLALEVHPEETAPADWQQPDDEEYLPHWASGRGSCEGWEIRNNYDMYENDEPPFPIDDIKALTIRVLEADGTTVIDAALASGEILEVPDASEDTGRSFWWGQNAGPDIPEGGLVELPIIRDLDGCDDEGDPHGLEGLYPAIEAAFSAPLLATGAVNEDLALIDPLIACVEDADPGNPDGYLPQVNNPEEIVGKVAVAQRGACPFTVKYRAAQDAGAIALVVINNAAGAPITMGGDLPGDYEAQIPAVMISLADGQPLVAAVNDGHTVNVTMSPDITLQLPLTPDEIASFTSRGPSTGGSGFKPEVTAPGVAIASANVGSGSGSLTIQGTSMAAPHVAGMAALMREIHPDLSVEAIKALIMNSGQPVAPATTPASRQGTGQIRVDLAASAGAYAGPAGIAFGRLNPTGAETVTETITVTNLEAAAKTFEITVEQPTAAGVSVSAPATVEVGPEGTATVDVTLSLDPAAMTEDTAFASHTEAWGRVVLEDGDDSLTLAYNAVVDPASAIAQVDGASALTNTGPSGGFADAFTPTGGATAGAIQNVGIRTGVASGDDVVELAIVLDDALESPNPYLVDIWVDVDDDGEDDFLLRAVDQGCVSASGCYNGVYVTSIFYGPTFSTGHLLWTAGVDFNDHVMNLRFDRYGPPFGFLDDDDTTFDYFIDLWYIRDDEAFVGAAEGSVDLDEVLDSTVDTTRFRLDAGATVSDLGAAGADGTMWLAFNNQVGSQAFVIGAPEPPEPPVGDTAGAFDANTGQWHLRNSTGQITSFYYGAPGDVPLMGDWNNDGVDTVGVYRPSNQTVYLRNTNSTGIAQITLQIGSPGDIPIAGDWDGNGFDTVSVYRPTTGQVFIVNSLTSVVVAHEYYFGLPGDKPFAGDFNADGIDTVGLHRESSGLVYFTNQHKTSFAENEFYFGIPNDRLIAGDWGIIDSIDTPGVFRPSNTTWYFRHTNTIGFADSEFVWGQSHWLPVAGSFGLD